LALEPLALRASIDELSNADLGAAEDALVRMRAAIGDYDLAQANWHFHNSLYRKAKRPLLLATLDAVHQNANRYQIMGASTRLRFKQSEREHQALLAACRARDVSGAVKVLEHHLRAASEVLLAHLRSISDASGSLTWPS
jgi:DNA-binding GntR family transcriptional regulator